MGMTIDEAIKYYSNKNFVLTEEEAEANTIALNIMRKYQQLQADYENRLKADMGAKLEVIKLRIDNLPEPLNRDRVNYCIQQKINELKAESEATHDV